MINYHFRQLFAGWHFAMCPLNDQQPSSAKFTGKLTLKTQLRTEQTQLGQMRTIE